MIAEQLAASLEDFLPRAGVQPGHIFVVGCSTSEVLGEHIGKAGSLEVAESLFSVLASVASKWQLYLAIQCCEHLNRALVVSRACQELYNLTEVMAVPHQTAGGALATVAHRAMSPALLVESIQAHCGIDIGNTLIGMHLRPVAVPVRLGTRSIGQANLVAARTRPKLIGGARARYE
jgi:uncharacterized protein (TIGR01440 family)